MEAATIVVVDDHPLFRQGVVDILSLEPDFKVVGEAGNGSDALTLIRDLQPDVAIVDINLPGVNGQQVVHQVAQEKLPTRVMLLTAYDDQEQVAHAARGGAAAYCAKGISPQWLVQTVKEVLDGKFVINQGVFDKKEFEHWLNGTTSKARQLDGELGNSPQPLSSREMEVLSLVVNGMSNKEIASLLGIGQQTVKNHVTSILRKFDVEDRTQAAVYAIKRGWVKLRDQPPPHQE